MSVSTLSSSELIMKE